MFVAAEIRGGRLHGHLRGQHARHDIRASDLADTRRIFIQVKTKSSGSAAQRKVTRPSGPLPSQAPNGPTRP